MNVLIIRPPYTSGYNVLDVREDAIITYLLGYLEYVPGVAAEVCDFHLNRSVRLADLPLKSFDAIVIAVREAGACVHYALRIAKAAFSRGCGRVILYGQTGRLAGHPDVPAGAVIARHAERELMQLLGLDGPTGVGFASNLQARSYFEQLSLPAELVRRRKASIETSRGCQFKCSFCFINHGENYPARWELRPVEMIVADVLTYRALGIPFVTFHDSEMLGASAQDHARSRQLFTALERDVPGLKFMMYARADTVSRFGDIDSMKRAGAANLFIGAESLSDMDLRQLNKGQTAERIVETIERVRDHGINMNLSFMTFNRGTSAASLRENLHWLNRLAKVRPRYLGMPNFLFSFESDWSTDPLERNQFLSHTTYVRWMAYKRATPSSAPAFDPELEPLMEVCRIVHYELAMKITETNLARDDAIDCNLLAIDDWYDQLWGFGLHVFERFLVAFERGQLTLGSLQDAVGEAREMVLDFYRLLPEGLRAVRSGLGEGLDLGRGYVPLEDHGYDSLIDEPAVVS